MPGRSACSAVLPANRPSSTGISRLIAGTSSCVMAMSPDERPFAGGWGPYYGAALPGCWIAEGGQSATGALLDHIIRLHGAGGEPTAERHRADRRAHRGAQAEEGLDLAGAAARAAGFPTATARRSPTRMRWA